MPVSEQGTLVDQLQKHFGDRLSNIQTTDMVVLEVQPQHLLDVCQTLRDQFGFEQLMDVCGVDYQDYGVSHWRTESTSGTGFSRAVESEGVQGQVKWDKPRFASVYHLLSLKHNRRLRIRVFLSEDDLKVPSVCEVWCSANWFEREAFDMFGIVYEGHPDLRRILTDYGFKGHPFRKDFPLIGEVELRYDANQNRCVYEPVSIQPRVLVPKVIRDDNRYRHLEEQQQHD